MEEDRFLYNAGMAVARERIRTSDFFVCLIIKGTHDNLSLVEQIDYAKELHKPFYLLIEKGAREPANINGAEVRARIYIDDHGQKAMEYAARGLWEKVSRDFPNIKSMPVLRQTPNLNDIVDWPPRKDTK